MGLLIRLRSALSGARATASVYDDAPVDVAADADEAFAALVRAALDELPDEVLNSLANTPVVVSDGGAAAGAYGLYIGATVARAHVPARVVIFRDTLVRDFGDDRRALEDEVRRTVRHEVAHHLGYDEDGTARLDL